MSCWENTDSKIDEIISTRLKAGVDDSFHVFNVEDVITKLDFWKENFPRVKPFYAMKANHSEIAIKTMAKLGTGFDCASMNEIKRVLDLGVHPDRIIYANPAKQNSHLKFAKMHQVNKMTFDNIDELHKIKSNFSDAKIVLRIRFDAKKVFLSLGEKFGCDPELEAPELIRKCKELNLDLIGISFHAGNDVQDADVFDGAIKTIKKLFIFAAQIGFKLNLVDIGGGFSGFDMEQVKLCAKFINKAIDDCFPDPKVEIISEPGSFFMYSSMKLLCNVHSKRVDRDKSGKIKLINYFISDGLFTSFLGHFIFKIDITARVFRSSNLSNNFERHSSIFWGQTCDSTDKVFETILTELQIGDWLIFDDDHGAYGFCRATEFNGFMKPEIVPLFSD